METETNTSALILCAGKSARFDGKIKQLLPIGAETVLERIQRQATGVDGKRLDDL